MHKCIVKPVDFKNLCLPPSHKDILLHFSIKVVWFQHLHLGFGSIFYFSYSFVLLRYNSHYHQSVQFSGFQYIHRVVQSSSQFIFYVLHKKKKKILLSITIFPSSQPLEGTNLFSVSIDLPILDISYKWKNTIYDLFYLASFISIMFSRFTNIAECVRTSFFLLINIPFFPCILLKIYLIPSSTHGH